MLSNSDPTSHFELFVLSSFLDERTCQEVIAETRLAQTVPATVYGRGPSGSVDEPVRKGLRLTASPETVESVRRKLMECKRQVEEHFRVNLNICEEPQFLRYRMGDFFVAHQDGNTGLLRLDQEARLVSVVIFLNREANNPEDGAYFGGTLVFSEWRPGRTRGKLRFPGEPGTLVAFRSETTHEVTQVTHGERHSIACWYR